MNKMETGIILAIISSLLAVFIGAGTSAYNNATAQKREEDARAENYKLNELAAEAADKRTRNLYTDFESPQAQYDQLKAAGLSPSLFYSKNGAGGGVSSTGAMGQGVAGIAPNTAMMGTPRELAEVNLMNAQANKAQSEADEINGVNERGQAEIQKLIAETYSKQAETEYVKIKTIGEEINNRLASDTYEDNVNYAHYKSQEMHNNALKLSYEIISAKSTSEVDAATVQTRIHQEENKNELLKVDVLFRQSSIQLNDAQIDKIHNEFELWREQMLQNYTKLMIEQQNANSQSENAMSYSQFVRNMDDFQDAQIQNLKDRLAMDEDHFSRRQKLEYLKLLQTMYDNAMARGTQLISSVLPMAAGSIK